MKSLFLKQYTKQLPNYLMDLITNGEIPFQKVYAWVADNELDAEDLFPPDNNYKLTKTGAVKILNKLGGYVRASIGTREVQK